MWRWLFTVCPLFGLVPSSAAPPRCGQPAPPPGAHADARRRPATRSPVAPGTRRPLSGACRPDCTRPCHPARSASRAPAWRAMTPAVASGIVVGAMWYRSVAAATAWPAMACCAGLVPSSVASGLPIRFTGWWWTSQAQWSSRASAGQLHCHDDDAGGGVVVVEQARGGHQPGLPWAPATTSA